MSEDEIAPLIPLLEYPPKEGVNLRIVLFSLITMC
jgi:hypothetical protein